MINAMKYIAYSAGTMFVLLGIMILFTNITPVYIPQQFKVMMGVVLFLYGMFRIVTTLFKERQKNDEAG